MPKRPHSETADRLGYLPWAALLGAARLLPYETRVAAAGRLGAFAVTHLPRLRARVETNLAHVMPELGPEARAAIARGCGDTFGRTGIEMFSARDYAARAPWRAAGPGRTALERAVVGGTGAIIVSGHFGQWEAGRAFVRSLGTGCAAVYRRVRNRRLDAVYHDNIAFAGAPIFPKSRRSMRGMLDHLSKGGVLALLVDQYDRRAPMLDFLGRPAPTTLIAAELALRLGLPLVPAFGIRQPDGVTTEIVFEDPIPHGAPDAMMQAFNDRLAAQVRAYPSQYYWLHRRWAKSADRLVALP